MSVFLLVNNGSDNYSAHYFSRSGEILIEDELDLVNGTNYQAGVFLRVLMSFHIMNFFMSIYYISFSSSTSQIMIAWKFRFSSSACMLVTLGPCVAMLFKNYLVMTSEFEKL